MQVVVDVSFPLPKNNRWYRFAKALADHQSAADDNAIAAD
jgi:hypothetical protein